MGKGRLEAFSDGVLAIIITIMVLELRVPAGNDFPALRPLLHVLLSYVLSFIYIGIYWNNHHHMLHAAEKINGRIMWANLHLLFWLSLVPFVTGWTGANGFAKAPVALYGMVLLMSGWAYYLLAQELAAHHGKGSRLASALGRDLKGLTSIVMYALAVPLAFVSPRSAFAVYVAVAMMWFVPDSRMENASVPFLR